MTTEIRSGPRATPPAGRDAARNLGGAVLLLALLVGACGSDDGDAEAFCAAVAALRADSPFEDLAVASPGEMRDAFDQLAEAAERIRSDAPPSVRVQARRYAETIDVLRDELAGGAYDPRRVDNRRYADAVADHTQASISLDNGADAVCERGAGGT